MQVRLVSPHSLYCVDIMYFDKPLLVCSIDQDTCFLV
jgi:hypothetical protein